MSAWSLERRYDPGFASSIALAALVHLILVVILLVGVRWQNRPPQAVTVELWQAPSPPPPKVEEPPEPPRPVPKAEPPPPPKAEPRIEKPDIAQKEPVMAKPKTEPRPVPKPEPRPRPAAPRDTEAQKRLREELAREQQQLALAREREALQNQLKREMAVDRARSFDAYAGKIKSKIKANIVLPPDIRGNPEAIFDVVQLPTGEVLSARLRKSSGHKAYDEAVERAIWKSSPLPKPDRPELFQRALELKFRPLDPV